MAKIKLEEVTREAKAALRHHGPNTAQLIKFLNSNDEKDMPSSRHIRWMAFEILKGRNIEIEGGFLVEENFNG